MQKSFILLCLNMYVTHMYWLLVVLLEHAAQALCDVGHLTQVELVVELDSRGQEVVHDIAVQLNGRIHQLAAHLDNIRVKPSGQVAVNDLLRQTSI